MGNAMGAPRGRRADFRAPAFSRNRCCARGGGAVRSVTNDLCNCLCLRNWEPLTVEKSAAIVPLAVAPLVVVLLDVLLLVVVLVVHGRHDTLQPTQLTIAILRNVQVKLVGIFHLGGTFCVALFCIFSCSIYSFSIS